MSGSVLSVSLVSAANLAILKLFAITANSISGTEDDSVHLVVTASGLFWVVPILTTARQTTGFTSVDNLTITARLVILVVTVTLTARVSLLDILTLVRTANLEVGIVEHFTTALSSTVAYEINDGLTTADLCLVVSDHLISTAGSTALNDLVIAASNISGIFKDETASTAGTQTTDDLLNDLTFMLCNTAGLSGRMEWLATTAGVTQVSGDDDLITTERAGATEEIRTTALGVGSRNNSSASVFASTASRTSRIV